MLVLTRRIGESLLLSPQSELDPDMRVGDLFADGPIEVTLLGFVSGGQAKLGISAPLSVSILRQELTDSEKRMCGTKKR